MSEKSDQMTNEPPPATTGLLEQLHADGDLSREAYEEARRRVWPAQAAWRWFQHGLLFAGAALVLAGIVFWFAYNWHAVPKFGKFAMIESALVGSLAGAWWFGLDERLGNVALFAAAMLVGVFLLVFGQIYQTGADPWQLFGGWAVFIVGFVLLARSQALWVLWATLVNTGLVLFSYQTSPDFGATEMTTMTLTVGLYDVALLAVREVARRLWDEPWLEPQWGRWMVLAVGLFFLSLPVWLYVGLGEEAATWAPVVSLSVWLTVLAGGFYYTRRVDFDLVSLTMIGVAASSLPVVVVYNLVTANSSIETALLFIGLTIFGATALLVGWLRRLSSMSDGTTPEVEGTPTDGGEA